MVAQRPAAGMGGDDRSLGQADAVPEGLVGGVGEIDHHPELVHFGHDLLPEGAQAMPMRPLGSTVGDGVVPVVRERHITDTQPIEGAQHRQRLLDGRPVLHADEDGNQSVLRVLLGLFRRKGQGRIVGIRVHGVIHGGNHFQRIARGGVRRHLRRRVEGEKRAADSPAPEFGEIDVPVPVVNADIPEPDQLRGSIDMAVKDLHHRVP